MQRLKLIEDENGKLKKLVANFSLGKVMPHDFLRGKLIGFVNMNELVDKVFCEWDLSIRRACTILIFRKPSYHYRSCHDKRSAT
jgi:hypothetical protein